MEIRAKSSGLSLKDHINDLLNAVKILPFEKLDYKRLKLSVSDIDGNYLKKLLQYAAFFHDLGKVSPAFQKWMKNSDFQPQIPDFPDIRHNILSLFFIDKEKIKELCNEDESLYATFLSAITFHHWKKDEKEYLLQINEDLIKASKLLLKDKNGERLAEILKNHLKGINGMTSGELILFDKHLANHLVKKGNLISLDILPPYTLYFLPERLRAEVELKINLNLWIFLSGFLMRVDHFASLVEQESLIRINEIEKEIPKPNIAQKLEERFGKDFWQKEANNLKNSLILIAPTGIGKTEFAFLWAEGEKFFYTLPLRVATNQIFDRACGYFNKDKKDTDDPFINGNVGLLHSDADLYLLEKSENSKKDIEGETPKILDLSRHFSLPVNICTGDQIFPAGLKYPQYEKIYATLGYSKLIIDEVQAYDPKACAIVVKMIEDIVSLGGKFLLMTATLPKFVRDEIAKKTDLQEIEIINYYERIPDITRHKIEPRERDIIEDVGKIIEMAKGGKRILVVLNTVKKAKDVFEKLEKKILEEKIKGSNIFYDLLHSKFTLNQRKEKERRLEQEFKNPKPKNENTPKILVATQVVEASLDIDADYLFTEIAPMDSLIQRMGRVMRRVKYNEKYTQEENNIFVYVHPVTDKNKFYIESGKGYVYENDILFITLCKLLELAPSAKNNEKLKYALQFFKNLDETEKKEVKKKEKSKKDSNELIKNLIESVLRNEKIEIPIQEKEKNNVVEEVYDFETFKYLKKSEYLKKFYNTLSILNSGYVSENREEAHKLFREIFTISVIEEAKVKEIAGKIKQKLLSKEEITWLWFKKEIIAEYVINDNMSRYIEYELGTLWEKLSGTINSERETVERIKRYCEGIWVCKKEKEKKSSEETHIETSIKDSTDSKGEIL